MQGRAGQAGRPLLAPRSSHSFKPGRREGGGNRERKEITKLDNNDSTILSFSHKFIIWQLPFLSIDQEANSLNSSIQPKREKERERELGIYEWKRIYEKASS